MTGERSDYMKDPYKRRYTYLMLAIFGGISMSILVYFLLSRFRGIGDILSTLSSILAPFIYGSVVAYLLRPMCNFYEKLLKDLLPGKIKKLADFFAVGLSVATGILIVYVLIIMIVPQLYDSILGLWHSLPDKVNSFLNWAMAIFGEDEELLALFNNSYTFLYTELENWASDRKPAKL